MKGAFLAASLALACLVLPIDVAWAESFYYYPHEAPYQELPLYDPYYQLHLIHYQLYLRQYDPLYPVSTVQVVVFPPQPKEIRARQQGKKR